MNNIDLATKALAVYYQRDKWTYLQGAVGNLAESDRSRGLYNYFWNQPNHANNTMTMPYNEWLINNIGKQCTDCSNFINYLLGYTYSQYSTKGYAAMKRYEGELSQAPLGSVLCLIDTKTNQCGHVGIVVGKDTFIDFYKYNETCRMGKISESLFTYAVYVSGVEYHGRTPKALSVRVNDIKHYVGDEVSKNDFTVSYIDDEGIIADTTEYLFTPTIYYNTANTIAIVYKGIEELIAYTVVNADSLGKLFVVQIPCGSQKEALETQSRLIREGYVGTSVLTV